MPAKRYEDLDYPIYAKTTYKDGRKQVKSELAEYENESITAADTSRAYADYDANMIRNVLGYAEFWRYLLGDREMPESVVRNIDREIFAGPGPYGRYTTYALWSPSAPPPIVGRGEKVNSLRLRAFDDFDGLQVKYGDVWSTSFGSSTSGQEHVWDIPVDDVVRAIDLHYGHKFGGVVSHTGSTVLGPVGNSRHAEFSATINMTGYAIASAYITNWSGHEPTGCESVILVLDHC